MAYNLQDTRTISMQAASDLSGKQFCFVKQDSTGCAVIADTNSFALGILENQPSATPYGQYACTVAVDGVTRLAVGGPYAIGTFLVPGSNNDGTGLGFARADVTSSYSYCRAVTLQTSTAGGDVVAVRLIGPFPGMSGDGTTAG